jgi:hypothetical protein
MRNTLSAAAFLALPIAFLSAQPVAAQALDPATGAPYVSPVVPAPELRLPPPRSRPSVTLGCLPGQVLDSVGDPCLPNVTSPTPHPSLRSRVPDPLPTRPAPLPRFFSDSNCDQGQVLQPSGEPC